MSLPAVKKHLYGPAGGYLVGRPHTQSGIKAINKATGQRIELQGREVVITAPAVEDPTPHDFDGETLTQRQILSRINVNGGGVSFEAGGEIPCDTCVTCSGNKHTLNGEELSDIEIFSSFAHGGEIADTRNFLQLQIDALTAALPFLQKDQRMHAVRQINIYKTLQSFMYAK